MTVPVHRPAGYTRNRPRQNGAYGEKAQPEKYKGNVADVTTVIRVALTKRAQTPDLYELLKLIGVEGIKSRFNKVA